MTRDIEDRLRTFITVDYAHEHWSQLSAHPTHNELDRLMREKLRDGGNPFEVRRIALNMDQVRLYDPPPNPAKLTDSRAQGYISVHGDESWELDALDPATLDELIRGHVEEIRDPDLYYLTERRESRDRQTLESIASQYHDVAAQFGPEEE